MLSKKSISWLQTPDIGAGLYNNVSFALQDQSFVQVPCNDNNILITLFIKLGDKKKLMTFSDTRKIS